MPQDRRYCRGQVKRNNPIHDPLLSTDFKEQASNACLIISFYAMAVAHSDGRILKRKWPL